MYNRYDIYMKQGVRDEAAYIKNRSGRRRRRFSLRQGRKRHHRYQDHSSGEKMVRCCLTVLRIRKKWKITVTDRNLLKLRSRGIR